MTQVLSSCEQQAIDFLAKHGIKFSCKFIAYEKHSPEDEKLRNVYRLTLIRTGKRASFRFGQSIVKTIEGVAPTAYDLLSCIAKNDPGSFEDFCSEYGYDTDSIKATKIYKDVCAEYKKVDSFFTEEEKEELYEIN